MELIAKILEEIQASKCSVSHSKTRHIKEMQLVEQMFANQESQKRDHSKPTFKSQQH